MRYLCVAPVMLVLLSSLAPAQPAQVVVPFEGNLQVRVTYRALVRRTREGISTVISLRFPEHQAIRVEWINLREFPALRRRRGNGELRIVFTVISDQIRQMTVRRWNRTVKCRVIRIE
jgi:hypothetical protein